MNSNAVPPTGIARLPLISIRTLHLFTLCCFAITQPLLTALEGQAVYLRDQQIGWLDIGVLLILLMVVFPLGFLGADRAVMRLSRFTRRYGRNAVFGFLFGVIFLSLLRPYLVIPWLIKQGYAGLSALAIAIPSAWLVVVAYDRLVWLRSWLTFASAGLVVFPGTFIWHFHAILRAEKMIEKPIEVMNPVPVVMVVFDEFSATTLMNEQMELDSQRFPHFARLAERSTWYRKMTTVHPRTGTAIPAILSGRFPLIEQPALASEFPGNLFQVIEASKEFDMAVFEPATRICPRSLTNIPEPERSLGQRFADLVHTLTAVYPRLIFTQDTPVYFPTIPPAWFGLRANTTTRSTKFSELTEGLFAYSRGLNREKQLKHFLKCIIPSDRARFCFIHAMIPHYPWCFFPSGEKYQAEMFNPQYPGVANGELGEDWPALPSVAIRSEYRYRQQVGFMDRFIGELLDRLDQTEVMDRCLLIVTSDHGVAFRPGHSRRVPDAENIAEIMSVPLFIKLPGQTIGRIDDRNVESIDLLPTVAEVLGIELPEPVDGTPVSNETRRMRKTIFLDKAMTVIEPDFPQLAPAIAKHSTVFGGRPLEEIPTVATSHLDWHGQPVNRFVIDARQVAYEKLDPRINEITMGGNENADLSPGFVCGNLSTKDFPAKTVDLVIAVDGVIQDTDTIQQSSSGSQYFEILLPQSVFVGKQGKIDLYLVDQTQAEARLRPLVAIGRE